ncbi:hypothetical protein MKY30_12730 [Oceanobacillus sp. FSL W8-0428]|uniref:hypothetical protein n=1 Tax=unclassified Oceanobacillus TaxID=2630292 RepID=UPI000A6E40B0
MNEKVTIPDEFTEKLVINGNSGDVSSDQLSTNNLDIETKSGDGMINIPISSDESQDEKEIKDTAGKGSFEIDVETISGNITARQNANGIRRRTNFAGNEYYQRVS